MIVFLCCCDNSYSVSVIFSVTTHSRYVYYFILDLTYVQYQILI
jgi:hypothetical protein